MLSKFIETVKRIVLLLKNCKFIMMMTNMNKFYHLVMSDHAFFKKFVSFLNDDIRFDIMKSE